MSELKAAPKVKYFYSVLYNKNYMPIGKVKELLKLEFSCENYFFPSFNPLFEYYSHEMGQELGRVIVYCDELETRVQIIQKKLRADKLERIHSRENKRTINIDVGYIAKEQLVLATGKPYGHRLFIGQGVYYELVYIYRNKTYNSLPWTYPDYQHKEKIEFFNSIR